MLPPPAWLWVASKELKTRGEEESGRGGLLWSQGPPLVLAEPGSFSSGVTRGSTKRENVLLIYLEQLHGDAGWPAVRVPPTGVQLFSGILSALGNMHTTHWVLQNIPQYCFFLPVQVSDFPLAKPPFT